jgi:hypothetical protein
MKNINEAINRGNNLMVVVFISLIAAGLVGELFMETEFVDKADDALIILFGIISIVWYLTNDNSVKFSYVPFSMSVLTLLTKIGAFIIEMDDKAAVGDEFGLIIPFALLSLVTFFILKRTRTQIERST